MNAFLTLFIYHIRMISEGSCDTEDWSNDAENSALIPACLALSAVRLRRHPIDQMDRLIWADVQPSTLNDLLFNFFNLFKYSNMVPAGTWYKEYTLCLVSPHGVYESPAEHVL